ncbi:SDR family oxidoreductase [Paucilactobacillus suebicus]|uniref:Short-chain dehydrogenase oxidoreductase n=1 Tax=Paucilactobacillus suebicus DSM 5007 = KCTC 3549 TaxID=1423807 RepID=A0A0R1W7J2_9LACO|nr:SDR family oxidoreductase [Paucilactobacillus suebicus]KRM13413.1 short-chain dehydrogenase oxidoreductase [Paucilactobacillus suebicus DSM 5007 = KCTC 3549]
MSSLDKKIVLIIGGASGFGFQTAVQSLKLGADVKIIGRHKNRVDDAVKQLCTVSSQISGAAVDASDEQQLKQYLEKTGKVDHVVSMLGGAMGGGFFDAPFEEIKHAIDQKFFTNLMVGRTVAPYIKDHGSLTFTSGTGGHPYDASGAIIGNQAINTMVAGMAVEAAPRIRVNAVAPTWTPTGLWRGLSEDQLKQNENGMTSQIPLNRVSDPEEVASAYIFLMNNEFVTGQAINVDGGISVV